MIFSGYAIIFQEDQLSAKSSQCEDLIASKNQLEYVLDEKKKYMHNNYYMKPGKCIMSIHISFEIIFL